MTGPKQKSWGAGFRHDGNEFNFWHFEFEDLGILGFFHVQLPFRRLETCIESAGKCSERGMQMRVKRTELGLQHVAPDEVKTET